MIGWAQKDAREQGWTGRAQAAEAQKRSKVSCSSWLRLKTTGLRRSRNAGCAGADALKGVVQCSS